MTGDGKIPVRIYCDGIYDLFHIGHAKALEQAKKAFPNVYLMVGVCNDEVTHEKKGLTVLTGAERAESVRHCKWVDEVIENAPWEVNQEFLEKHKIDFVAHDDIPYADSSSNDVYAFVKAKGKFLATKRTPGISTSEIINRITSKYEQYIERNRKRGLLDQ